MIYSIEQVQRGIARYIDEEFTAKLTGWQKWVIGAAGGMYTSRLGNIVEHYRKVPAVEMLGIFPEGGGIDIDVVYHALMEQAQKSPATFDMPVLGSVTLNADDVEKLYRCIERS